MAATQREIGLPSKRVAAAEERRRRILAHGGDRLRNITVGPSASTANDTPAGDTIQRLPALPSSVDEAPLCTPPDPEQTGAKRQTSDNVPLPPQPTVQPSSSSPHAAHAHTSPAQAAPSTAERPRTAARAQQWAADGDVRSGAAEPSVAVTDSAVRSPEVWAAACAATHSARLMLALVLPVLAHAGQGSCLAVHPSGWDRALCSSAQAPLLQLLALQALILVATYWTLSLQPRLLAGQLKAQKEREGDMGSSFMSLQPVGLLLRMAGLPNIMRNMRMALAVVSSVMDALAVYVFMAALTCTVELQLQDRAWFGRSGDIAPVGKPPS